MQTSLRFFRTWDGSDAATLYLDGLDAHRAGPSWLADLVDELRDTRWRVVGSQAVRAVAQ